MFMYVMWDVSNIQDRADWGGQAWLFQSLISMPERRSSFRGV